MPEEDTEEFYRDFINSFDVYLADSKGSIINRATGGMIIT